MVQGLQHSYFLLLNILSSMRTGSSLFTLKPGQGCSCCLFGFIGRLNSTYTRRLALFSHSLGCGSSFVQTVPGPCSFELNISFFFLKKFFQFIAHYKRGVYDLGNFNWDTSSFSSSTTKNILLPTGGQKALVDVTTVLAPDEYQKDEQQTFEQHQRVEYVNLESVEADKVQCVVQGSYNHGAQVRQ
ncbi:hypothetical protein AGLY_015001 [Aphis glycines]|uniref:Uncharacterized protein n=1 Tax=Aphis glycines TaxID=307491 RepID=A0A6G0T4W0_APHGL|nr:hypothetical protein AGLY_015001 [Aphis glycines]